MCSKQCPGSGGAAAGIDCHARAQMLLDAFLTWHLESATAPEGSHYYDTNTAPSLSVAAIDAFSRASKRLRQKHRERVGAMRKLVTARWSNGVSRWQVVDGTVFQIETRSGPGCHERVVMAYGMLVGTRTVIRKAEGRVLVRDWGILNGDGERALNAPPLACGMAVPSVLKRRGVRCDREGEYHRTSTWGFDPEYERNATEIDRDDASAAKKYKKAAKRGPR